MFEILGGLCFAGSLGNVQHERQTGALLAERSLEQQEKAGSVRRSVFNARQQGLAIGGRRVFS